MELQRLRADGFDELFLSQVFGQRKTVQPRVAFDAGGVGKQMPYGDVGPGVRQVLQVFADFVIHGELAILREEENPSGRKLFGDRADLEDGFRRDARAQLQIGQAIALGLDRGAIPNHGQGHTGNMPLLHLRGQIIIHLVGARRQDQRQKQD